MAVSQAKEARPLVELPQVRPNHLRSFSDGRREIVVSLHTRDEGQARARVLAIALETEKAFQRAREQFHALVVDPDAMAKEWKAQVLRDRTVVERPQRSSTSDRRCR